MISYFNDDTLSEDLYSGIAEYLRGILAEEENHGATYMAGTLIIKRTEEEPSICINIDPLSELPDNQKELCYLASQLYIKYKSPTAHFYNQSKRNIEEYKTFKKLDDFINVRNEFSDA